MSYLCNSCEHKNTIVCTRCLACENYKAKSSKDYKNCHCEVKTGPDSISYTYTFKTITNADRVRSMTDEELFKWYWWMLNHLREYTDSHLALREWLQQEVGAKDVK